MSRYTGPASITLNGDKKLAARYVSEGRKYLGALQQTSPVQTAVREITNAEGVHFRVGYYGGQPFIEITATLGGGDVYSLAVFRGYITAPRTTLSYTGYSANPAVIINPFKGVDSLWASSFFNAPDPLSGATHPTSGFVDAFSAYSAYFPGLSSNVFSNTHRFASPRTMSWNNSDESLWLYWYGCEHGRTSHSPFGEVYHNGKLLLDLSYLLGDAMLMGVGAKRTGSGLTLYLTVLDRVDTNLGNLKLCRVALIPSTSELGRLRKLEIDSAYGYASEYDADTGSFTTLISYPVTGSKRYYSSFPHNQSANESRGFIGVAPSTDVALSEYVIDYSDESAISISIAGTESIVQTVAQTTVFGDTVHYGNLVRHVNIMIDTLADTRAPGLYEFTEYTVPYKEARWTSKNNNIFPATYSSRAETVLNVNKIRCLVDYREDVPVYAYIHISNDVDEIESSTTYELSVTAPTAHLAVEVFATYPVTSNSLFTSSVSWLDSYVATYTNARQIKTIGISAPIYDANGAEDGDWLNETELSSSWEYKYAASENNMIAHYQYGNAYSGVLYNHLLSPGCTAVKEPEQVNSGQETKSVSVGYLNLRNRTAFYAKTKSYSVDLQTRNFGALTYATYGSGYETWIHALEHPNYVVTHTESLQQARTRLIHGGIPVFDSGWVNTAAPTNVDNTSATVSWPITFFAALKWVPYVNSTGYITGAGNITNSVSAYNPFGVVASHPDPDVDTSYQTPVIIATPLSASYLLYTGQPSGSVGVSATKNTYIANANYLSGIGGAKTRLVITNNLVGTLDYMTGAHAAPWFTSPFLISAIAVKKLKQ